MINKIRAAIAELQQEGKNISASEIGKKVGVSRQYVHRVLSEHDELSELTWAKRRDSKEGVLRALENYDTANLYIDDILKLPIQGMEYFTYHTLRMLLIEKEVPYHYTVVDRIDEAGIDVTKYSARELYEILGSSDLGMEFNTFVCLLRQSDVDFRRVVVTDKDMKERCAVLDEVDTTKHTLDELHEMIGLDIDKKRVQRYFLQQEINYQRLTGKVRNKKKM